MKNADDEDSPHQVGEIAEDVLSDLLDRPQRCFVEDGFIVFRDLAGYDIPLSKCNTYDKILGWQLQLSPKQGMTLDLLMQFTLIACDYHKLPIAR
jgi:hypothetical protein